MTLIKGFGFNSASAGGSSGAITYYTIDVPYVASYAAGTIIEIVISGTTYPISITSAQTPAQIAALLTALGKGAWTQSHIGGNTHFVFVPTAGSVLTSFVINTGVAWAAQVIAETEAINSVFFIDAYIGWCCTTTGNIFKTIDGGTTWSLKANKPHILNSIRCVDVNSGWCCGSSGVIYKTTDGGTTWNAQTSGVVTNLYSIFFIDTLKGWCCGGLNNTAQVMLYSIDGGITWTPQRNLVANCLYSVYFTDALTGWAVGGYNAAAAVILKTINGGTTWNAQVSPNTNCLFSVWAADSTKAVACGYNGTITKTINGATWAAMTSGVGTNLNSITGSVSDSSSMYACGNGGVILNSTTAGIAWAPQASTTTDDLKSIFATTASIAWCSGGIGGLSAVMLSTESIASYTVTTVSGTANQRADKNIPVVGATQTITFIPTPFASADWGWVGLPAIFDSNGDPVSYSITNPTANGFDITPNSAGKLSYTAFI